MLKEALFPTDNQARLDYALRFQQLARDNADFMNNLVMSDEVHFYLNGFFNKQNSKFWGFDNPRNIMQHHFNS